MKLQELIEKVQEDSLSKEDLEKYGDQLAYLFSKMMNEIATLEKQEALFMVQDMNKSVAERKVLWKASQSGLRLIELKRWSMGCSKIINSVKSRVFRLIY